MNTATASTTTDASLDVPVPTAAVKTRKARVSLTEENRTAIRQRLAAGDKQADIAKDFGCSVPTISNIHRGYKTLKPRPKATDAAPALTEE